MIASPHNDPHEPANSWGFSLESKHTRMRHVVKRFYRHKKLVDKHEKAPIVFFMDDPTTLSADEFRALPDYAAQYYALLDEWQMHKDTLDAAKEAEMRCRVLLCALTFPAPTEGSNVHKFANGSKLTLGYIITRKVDEAALGACLADLGEPGDTLIRYKAELAVTAYKALTEEQKAIMAPAVIASPGAPQLKFAPAK